MQAAATPSIIFLIDRLHYITFLLNSVFIKTLLQDLF